MTLCGLVSVDKYSNADGCSNLMFRNNTNSTSTCKWWVTLMRCVAYWFTSCPECTCLVEGPVPNHVGVLPSVLSTEEHASWSAEEGHVSLAHKTNSGRVYDFGHLLDVVDEDLENYGSKQWRHARQIQRYENW